jgi:hypothetical protein
MTELDTAFGDPLYLDAVTAALGDAQLGVELLDRLEFRSCLGLDTPDDRSAFAAMFYAQGSTLRSTPALAVTLGEVLAPGEGAFGSYRATVDDDEIRLIVDPFVLSASRIVIDLGAAGLWMADPSALAPLRDSPLAPDAMVATSVRRASLASIDTDRDHAGGIDVRRQRARNLARLGASIEILGAASGAFSLALLHGAQRQQFQRPVQDFQAVRHLLADGFVHLDALRNACAVTMQIVGGRQIAGGGQIAGDGVPESCAALKALAGRNALRTLASALQVLGAIGFTAEHDHHRFQARVLLLDSIFGSSAELGAELGRDALAGRRLARPPILEAVDPTVVVV